MYAIEVLMEDIQDPTAADWLGAPVVIDGKVIIRQAIWDARPPAEKDIDIIREFTKVEWKALFAPGGEYYIAPEIN